jgi:hypothetical protein
MKRRTVAVLGTGVSPAAGGVGFKNLLLPNKNNLNE